MNLIQVEGLKKSYGDVHAVRGLDLEIAQGEIFSLLGPNGAGKSTMIKVVSGLLRPTSGQLIVGGRDVTGAAANALARAGLCTIPEGRGIFPGMTVLENLEMGKFHRKNRKAEMNEDLDNIYTLFPRLKERSSQAGGTLSGGEQQMLAIGRALMSRPKVLLLDEPSMGLAPLMIANIFRIITQINKQGVTILLVEQNAQQALTHAHRAYVLETGLVTKEANAKDLLNDPYVKAAYLGTGA